MKPPIFVQSLTDQERRQLQTGLRPRESFTLWRCQIVLASSTGQKPSEIAATVECAVHSVRNAIKAFNERGLASLEERSHRRLSDLLPELRIQRIFATELQRAPSAMNSISCAI